MVRIRTFMREWPVAWFVALTFLATYGIGLPWALLSGDFEEAMGLREGFLSLMIMRYSPTIAGLAIVAAVAGKSGLQVWLVQLLRWRVSFSYYLAVVGFVAFPFLVSLAATFTLDELATSPDLAASRNWLEIVWLYLEEIFYIPLTNGEETGWRFALLGLLLPRMKPLFAMFIIGVIWSVWHMPAFFLFEQSAEWYPLVIICMAWGVLYGWIYLRTGSLLLPVLAHGLSNATFYAFERLFPSLNAHWEAIGATEDWFFAAGGTVIAIAVILVDRVYLMTYYNPPVAEDWVSKSPRPAI
ncbi:type II CAAX endopeptidase family protein [Erythrobacter sp.]|uniref:CPBP family intramembrane glutamic endopeptidase n=1 Tax=Erythrobacter sp. TaxID=1042 RepID=UPI00311E5DDA